MNQHWSVVHAECCGHTAFDDEDVKLVDEVSCDDRGLHFSAPRFSGVLINDGENLEQFPGHGRVEREIKCPHIPWSLRFGDGGQVRNPDTFLAAPHDYAEAFFAS